ncbi:hypothetical protein Cni_G07836 [Canna indica]|uniref:Uncharacterized protein n=1 Tax=Canna indica TaxID=4628 RepID=A0AAQ3JZ77_9LILI|nr:hypothetical protein Cni_G07836 [Canna indica]
MSSSCSSLLRRRIHLFRLRPFHSFIQQRPRPLSVATSSSSPDSFTVNFLTTQCNFPLPAALTVARALRIDESSTDKPLAVVSLLRSHGLSPSHVARLVAQRPVVLLSRPERTLAPKLRFLSSFLPPSFVSDLLLICPCLLSRSLQAHIEPLFSLLRCFLDSPEALFFAARRGQFLFTCNLQATVAPNIALLLSSGVRSGNIAKLLSTHPHCFVVPAARFVEAVNNAISVGVGPGMSLFIYALRAMLGIRQSRWETRSQVFKRLGWSEEEFRIAFQRAPLFVLVSDQKIKKMANFLMKEAQLKASDLSRQPKLLMYSLENRLLPRFRVFQVLEAKGMLKNASENKRNGLIIGMFTCTEGEFVDRYVRRHNTAAPELMGIYNCNIGNKKVYVKKAEGDTVHGSSEKSISS